MKKAGYYDKDYKERHFPYVCNACSFVLPNNNPDEFTCLECNQHYCQECYIWHLGAIGHSVIDPNFDSPFLFSEDLK